MPCLYLSSLTFLFFNMMGVVNKVKEILEKYKEGVEEHGDIVVRKIPCYRFEIKNNTLYLVTWYDVEYISKEDGITLAFEFEKDKRYIPLLSGNTEELIEVGEKLADMFYTSLYLSS